MGKMEKLLDDDAIKDFHSSMKNFDSASRKLELMMPKIEHFFFNYIQEVGIYFNKLTGL